MNWSKEWGKPVAPEFAKPQLDKITEEAKQASEWVKTVQAASEMLKQPNEFAPVIVGIDYGSKDQSFETLTQDSKIISQYEIKSIQLGNKSILVTVVGDLGLDFCEPGEKDEGWNIYHLPTLACFSSAVPNVYMRENIKAPVTSDYEYDKQPLLNWMAKVQENYGINWLTLSQLTPDTYQDNGKVAKEIIQKWCLSVKVE